MLCSSLSFLLHNFPSLFDLVRSSITSSAPVYYAAAPLAGPLEIVYPSAEGIYYNMPVYSSTPELSTPVFQVNNISFWLSVFVFCKFYNALRVGHSNDTGYIFKVWLLYPYECAILYVGYVVRLSH